MTGIAGHLILVAAIVRRCNIIRNSRRLSSRVAFQRSALTKTGSSGFPDAATNTHPLLTQTSGKNTGVTTLAGWENGVEEAKSLDGHSAADP